MKQNYTILQTHKDNRFLSREVYLKYDLKIPWTYTAGTHTWQQSVHNKVKKSPESSRKIMRVHYDLNHYMEEETNWLVLTVINCIISVVLTMTDNTDFLVSRRCSLVSHVIFF
jgi:hypothetical protein